MLSIRNLAVKTYSWVASVPCDGVSLDIPPRYMFGLIGPNESRQSPPFMKILATLLDPDSGTWPRSTALDLIANQKTRPAGIARVSAPRIRRLSEKMSAIDMLKSHLAVMKGITKGVVESGKRLSAVCCSRPTCVGRTQESAGRLFRGTKLAVPGLRRRYLANPKLIIVDEPTAGL